MKVYSTIFILLLICLSVSTVNAQVDWTKDSTNNPVLVPGSAGTWNDHGLFPFSILFKDGTYHLWYGGFDGANARIGYATSPDGIAWTPYAGNPVLNIGAGGTWNDEGVSAPCVLFDGNVYHMWYTGENGQHARIGYATSQDGIAWTPYANNPVFNIGSIGSWDDDAVFAPDVFFNDMTYHMWYSGNSVSWEDRIGYATSEDGITWTRYIDNPVLEMGETGEWDSKYVTRCRVLKDTTLSIYKMWYGGGVEDYQGSFSYATSPDTMPVGIHNVIAGNLSSNYLLVQNYPNPFNPSTKINYTLPKSVKVKIEVFNVLGQKISTLVNKQMPAGTHEAEFTANNLSSGVYYYRIQAGSFQQTRKMIYLK
jgi:predicted GH43/DUF377 family glycosyl hydrolase